MNRAQRFVHLALLASLREMSLSHARAQRSQRFVLLALLAALRVMASVSRQGAKSAKVFSWRPWRLCV